MNFLKTSLHWLRWDLRRFRLLLRIWVLLLAAFTLWVGYVNWKILTIDLRVVEALYYGAWPVLAYGAGLCCYILSTDSSPGARAFWKTRPPQGTAIAVAKLALTGTFFVLLPVLCAWLVSLLQAPPSGDGMPLPRLSLHNCIWFLCVAAWTCAGYSNWIRALVRLAVGLIPLYLLTKLDHYYPGTNWFDHLMLSASGVFLLICIGVCSWTYCQGWKYRIANKKVLILASIVPFFAPLPGAVWHSLKWSRRKPPAAPQGAPFRGNVTLGMPPLGLGGDRLAMNSSPESIWHFTLSAKGLPDDCVAAGSWLDLSFTSPDGSKVMTHGERWDPWESLSGQEMPIRFSGDSNGKVVTRGVVIRNEDLEKLAVKFVRLDGVCRLHIRKRKIITTPLPVPGGAIQLTSGMSIKWERIPFDVFQPSLKEDWIARSFDGHYSNWRLDNGLHRFDFYWGGLIKNHSGFISPAWGVSLLRPQGMVRRGSAICEAEYRRDREAGRADRWQLVRHQYEPAGWMDVKVSLPSVLFAFNMNTWPVSPDLIKDLRLPEDGNTEGTLLVVRQGLDLAQQVFRVRTQDRSWSLVEPLAALLAQTGYEHLPGMLDMLSELLPPLEAWKYESNPTRRRDIGGMHPPDQRCFDLLAARVVELLTPADIPELRKRKKLYAALAERLVERKLVPASEAGPGRYTDAELFEEWHAGLNWGLLREDILGEAVVRGLPWVPGELVIIAEDHSSQQNVAAICAALSAISTCPPEHEPGVAWLKENAARLRWDTAARRWAVPAAP